MWFINTTFYIYISFQLPETICSGFGFSIQYLKKYLFFFRLTKFPADSHEVPGLCLHNNVEN